MTIDQLINLLAPIIFSDDCTDELLEIFVQLMAIRHRAKAAAA